MLQSAQAFRTPENTRGTERLISSTPINCHFLTYAKKSTNARRRIVPKSENVEEDREDTRNLQRSRIVKTVLQIVLNCMNPLIYHIA